LWNTSDVLDREIGLVSVALVPGAIQDPIIPPAAEMPVNGHKNSLAASLRHSGSGRANIANDCPQPKRGLEIGPNEEHEYGQSNK
jgi:hypothetical protein